MYEVVAERDRFGELFVQPKHLGDGSRDLRHFERVGEARSIMVACRREKDLRFVSEPPERFAMDDAVAVALKRGTDVVFTLGTKTTARRRTFGRLRGKNVALACLELLSNRGHTDVTRGDRRACREQSIILCGLGALCVLTS